MEQASEYVNHWRSNTLVYCLKILIMSVRVWVQERVF